MIVLLRRYIRWLHTGWPAGTVEKLPEVGEDGVTALPGVRVVGDLGGIPLLKFSSDTGARAVQAIVAEPEVARRRGSPERLDLVIVGGGVSGIAAAIAAQEAGLSFRVYEAVQPFNTVHNFPKAKPIYTYPTEMTPAGQLQLTAEVKEALLEELEAQRIAHRIEVTRAHVEQVERRGDQLLVQVGSPGRTEPVAALRVILALGRTGNYRSLQVPGEQLDKVCQRLYDPTDFADQEVLVVGGGDSALESAVALALAGARVSLSYRGRELVRPKPENVAKLRALEHDPGARIQIEHPASERVNPAFSLNQGAGARAGRVRVLLGSRVREITADEVRLSDAEGQELVLPNQVVFSMIGRQAPLELFRRSGIPIRGEWRARSWASFALFLSFCALLYNWKAGGALNQVFRRRGWFPYHLPTSLGPGPLLTTIALSLREPGFYYSLAYCLCVIFFGLRRIRRRDTPYVRRQTLTLMAIQTLPLFLLPYLILPWAGHAGALDGGALKLVADNLFPSCDYGQGREYWRAFGLVLAWPLFIWNVFTPRPMTWWLVIGGLQTFVLIPLILRRWGKGAYCSWICSCGALAETMGDQHRAKMPHGPRWNRLNLLGQAILAFALLLLVGRAVSWAWPGSAAGQGIGRTYDALLAHFSVLGIPLDYYHLVDLFLAGIVGVGCYFWLSGRVWCRFACPLAALMHVYTRFSRFRIWADKKKCISCNVCTTVCHQGIDVMSFAQKGLPMEDPQCVRCSACVEGCPTGTLRFGRVGPGGEPIYDALEASPVLRAERDRVHLPVVRG